MSAYHNEFDAGAAVWLRELIKAGHIAPGDVDERSIADVRPDDLRGYTQCHFFAGIGGWPYALRLAGWPDNKPVWTGSCPCQPLSGAGQRKGHADERHLWPAFYRLIAECHPPTIFGEQVASADGREWLAGIRADLEALGYAVGAADLCAAGVGAPHIRQRLYWMANALPAGRSERRPSAGNGQVAGGGSVGGMADAGCECGAGRRELCDVGSAPIGDQSASEERKRLRDAADDRGATRGLGHACGQGLPQRRSDRGVQREALESQPGQAAIGAGFWSDSAWLPCTDGKARRIEPGSFPLAHGVPGRVGLLRGYGNAIVPQVAAIFIRAVHDHGEDHGR